MKPIIFILCALLLGCAASEPTPIDVPARIDSANEQREPIVIEPRMCSGNGTGE